MLHFIQDEQMTDVDVTTLSRRTANAKREMTLTAPSTYRSRTKTHRLDRIALLHIIKVQSCGIVQCCVEGHMEHS